MKRGINFGKRFVTMVTIATLAMTTGATAYAAEKAEEPQTDVVSTAIDINRLAKENDVNPYELKAAIEESMDETVASPFSSLATNTPNVKASESVEPIGERVVDGMVRNVKVTKKNQDSTAYVAKSGALTASGKTPTVGMCAMHINVTTKTGETSDSIVRLGEVIYMDNAVDVNGRSLSMFVVEDRGNPSNRTDFWIDIYFGQYENTSSDTYKAAINYGIKTVSYSYYY